MSADRAGSAHGRQPGTDAAASGRLRVGVRTAVVLVLFGLLYAYDLFEAISNVLGVTAQIADYNAAAAEVGLDAVAVPWTLLVATVAIVPVAYVAAVLVARRRGVGVLCLALAVGLAVVAALTLSLAAFA